jgi:hypothetical protein
MKAVWCEGGGKVLLCDNTEGGAALLRHCWSCISAGIRCTVQTYVFDHVRSNFRRAQNSTGVGSARR